MANHREPASDLREALERLADGRLPDEECEQLEQTLLDDADLLEQYIEHMVDTVLLAELTSPSPAAPSAANPQTVDTTPSAAAENARPAEVRPIPPEIGPTPPSPDDVQPAQRSRPLSRPVSPLGPLAGWAAERWLEVTPIVLFGALMLVLGALVGLRLAPPADTPPEAAGVQQGAASEGHLAEVPAGRDGGPRLALEPHAPAGPSTGGNIAKSSVAVLLEAEGLEWAVDEGALEPGSRLTGGVPLRITAGSMVIVFDCGARLVLEGPATLVPESAGRCRLDAGTLAADVPPMAIGFEVKTPNAVVRDLGTRFAVQVDPARVVHVAVFEGEVVLSAAASSWPGFSPVRLSAGQGRRLPSADPRAWRERSAESVAAALARLAGRLGRIGDHVPAEPSPSSAAALGSGHEPAAMPLRPLVIERFIGGTIDPDLWEVVTPRYGDESHQPIVSRVEPLAAGGIRLVNAPVLAVRRDLSQGAAPRLDVRTRWRTETDGEQLRVAVRLGFRSGVLCTVGSASDVEAHHAEAALVAARDGHLDRRLQQRFPCPLLRAGEEYDLRVMTDKTTARFVVRKAGDPGWERTLEMQLPDGFHQPDMGRVMFSNRGSEEKRVQTTPTWSSVLEEVQILVGEMP